MPRWAYPHLFGDVQCVIGVFGAPCTRRSLFLFDFRFFYYVVFPCNYFGMFVGHLRRCQENFIKG